MRLNLRERLLELGRALREEYPRDSSGTPLNLHIAVYLDPEIKDVEVYIDPRSSIAIWGSARVYLVFRIREEATRLNVEFEGVVRKSRIDSLYMKKRPDKVWIGRGFLIEETLEESERNITFLSLREALFGQGWVRKEALVGSLWIFLFLKRKFPDFLYRAMISRVPGILLRK